MSDGPVIQNFFIDMRGASVEAVRRLEALVKQIAAIKKDDPEDPE